MKTLVSIAILIFAYSVKANTVVDLAGDPWPPFVMGSKDGLATEGLAVVLIKKIFAEMNGVDVQFPLYPWKRSLQLAREGKVDGIGPLLKTKEREEYLIFTESFMTGSAYMYYRIDRFPNGLKWKSAFQDKKYIHAVERAISYGKMYDELIKSKSISMYFTGSHRQAIHMLVKGRVDIVVLNKRIVDLIVRENKWQNILTYDPIPINQDIFFIGISKKSKSKSLVPRINQAIRKLKKQGVLH